jgi:hypothetical protein
MGDTYDEVHKFLTPHFKIGRLCDGRSGSIFFIKSATLFLMSLIMDIVEMIELSSCDEEGTS